MNKEDLLRFAASCFGKKKEISHEMWNSVLEFCAKYSDDEVVAFAFHTVFEYCIINNFTEKDANLVLLLICEHQKLNEKVRANIPQICFRLASKCNSLVNKCVEIIGEAIVDEAFPVRNNAKVFLPKLTALQKIMRGNPASGKK